MQVQRYGLKWTKKAKGYYQSTTTVDGKRLWLHQYTYAREHGEQLDGAHIHHKDGDKDNNELGNLQRLSAEEHAAEHSAERSVLGKTAEQLLHLERARVLCAEARAGKYVSRRRQRKDVVRTRTCPECRKEFILKSRDKDSTAYCSEFCHGRQNALYAAEDYAKPVPCLHCGTGFVPGPHGIGHQIFCSDKCLDKHRYETKHISRKCQRCGVTMQLSKGNAPRYCLSCAAAGTKHKHSCTCCGREVLSIRENDRVYCCRKCANLMRRFDRDPALHERYKQAVREGRVDSGDRVPPDL